MVNEKLDGPDEFAALCDCLFRHALHGQMALETKSPPFAWQVRSPEALEGISMDVSTSFVP